MQQVVSQAESVADTPRDATREEGQEGTGLTLVVTTDTSLARLACQAATNAYALLA